MGGFKPKKVRARVTQHERWSVVDTNSGYVDIVIVWQRVQHLHHWCFNQFQCESTNTAAPEGKHTHTHTHSPRLKFARFSRISPCLQSGTADRPVQCWAELGNIFRFRSFYKLHYCLQLLMCRLPMVPWGIPQAWKSTLPSMMVFWNYQVAF